MKKLIIILAAVISVSAASAQGYYNNRSHGITQEKAYRQRPDDTKQWNGNDRHAVAGNQSLYQKDIRPFNDNYRSWDQVNYDNDRNYNGQRYYTHTSRYDTRYDDHRKASTLGKVLITGAIAGYRRRRNFLPLTIKDIINLEPGMASSFFVRKV